MVAVAPDDPEAPMPEVRGTDAGVEVWTVLRASWTRTSTAAMMGGIAAWIVWSIRERSAVADSVEPAPPVARPVAELEAVDVVSVELVPGGSVTPDVALEVAIARREFESARSRERE